MTWLELLNQSRANFGISTIRDEQYLHLEDSEKRWLSSEVEIVNQKGDEITIQGINERRLEIFCYNEEDKKKQKQERKEPPETQPFNLQDDFLNQIKMYYQQLNDLPEGTIYNTPATIKVTNEIPENEAIKIISDLICQGKSEEEILASIREIEVNRKEFFSNSAIIFLSETFYKTKESYKSQEYWGNKSKLPAKIKGY